MTAVILSCLLTAGCSINKMVVNRLSDAVSAGGTVYASDDDPELVRDAVPFSLKLLETLLEQNPEHLGLLTAAASGFTQYAYAFIQQDADRAALVDFEESERLRARARHMYLRARDYALRGLELEHPGIAVRLLEEPIAAAGEAGAGQVPLLYWAAASWAAAISVSKDQPALIADLPQVSALLDRAMVLDEAYDHGALHALAISMESARNPDPVEAVRAARAHFERAAALSQGALAGPYVALAEAVTVPAQDVEEFRSLLKQALAVDPDERPEWRLVNLVMQQRARWLLSITEDLFLLPPSGPTVAEDPC